MGKGEDPGLTLVCRCEDVTLDDLKKLLAEGVTGLEEIKRRTRCTMGPCQGRTCRQLVTQELARHLGVGLGELAQPAFRPPTKPIQLGTLADEGRDPPTA